MTDEYIEHSARQLADDIDFEVISGILIQAGWTKVVLRPMVYEDSQSIDQWLEQKCKAHKLHRGLVFLFEDPKDASWFTLRWYK